MLGAVAVLGALGVTQGYRFYQVKTKEHREFVHPATELPKRMAAAEQHGLTIEPPESNAPGNGNEILAKIPSLALRHGAIFDSSKIQYLSPSELGQRVTADTELRATFDGLRDATEFREAPDADPAAILKTTNHNAERLAVRVLCAMATHQAEQGQHKAAADYLAAAGRINTYLAGLSEDVSVIAWFGNSRMIAATVLDLIGGVTQAQRPLYRDVVAAMAKPPALETVISGDIRRMTQAAKGIREFDEDQLVQLNSNGLNEGPLPDHPQTPDAMISQVLAFWDTALEIVKRQESTAFEAGVIIDGLTRDWQKDLNPSNYLIRTMPVTYEQVGRTITRGEQLMTALQAMLAKACGENVAASESLKVNEDGGTVTITLTDAGKSFTKPRGRGVDISQEVGVRLTADLG